MSRFVTVFWLLVMLLVPLAWWRGAQRAEGFALITPGRNICAVANHRGRLLILFSQPQWCPGQSRSRRAPAVRAFSMPPEHLFDPVVRSAQRPDGAVRCNLLGFVCGTDDRLMTILPGQRTLLLVPPWLICFAAGVMLARPALKRPPPPGHCRTCGYDLRASAGRCPECGSEIDRGADVAATGA